MSSFLNRRFAIAAFMVLSSMAIVQDSAQAQGPLNLFKNYFVTGDYVSGGVGLRGLGVTSTAIQAVSGGVSSYATGVIHISGIPGYLSNGVGCSMMVPRCVQHADWPERASVSLRRGCAQCGQGVV